jgi:hypothetical protein
MARINKGDTLSGNILQPGWKLSDDGFGLHTISATYKTDNTTGFQFLRGDPFTVGAYSYCKLHKQTSSFDALGIQTAVCEFVGISPDINDGDSTNAQLTTNGGLTTEKIETIPNFTVEYEGQPELNIAGGPPYTQSELGPLVAIKNNGDLNSVVKNGNSLAITKQNSYIGSNGACFENSDGGKFLGFVDPSYPYFYGKSSYLAAQQTFSGIIYVSSDALANKFIDMVSLSSGDGSWNGNLPYIMPTYLTGPWVQTISADPPVEYNQLLLTQANIESFGDLYKVTYEIKFSIPGWHPAIYNPAQPPA